MIIDNRFLIPWRDKDNEEREQIEYFIYYFSALSKVMNLYEIMCDEIATDGYNILKYAFINGHCGLKKFSDGKYYVGMGSYAGQPDADGYGKNYIVSLLDGRVEQGKIGEDVVVFRYNNIGFPMFEKLNYYADMLAKTDTSINYNVLYTRVCPIPIVETDNEKKSLEEVVKNLFKGKLSIFKREQRRGIGLYDDKVQEKNMLELTNPQASEYLQHLSRFHDEMLKRMSMDFGVQITERDKGAQLNDKELDAFKDFCAIGADDTFCMLKKFAEEVKNIFNLDITVRAKNFVTTEEDIKDDSFVDEKRKRG